MDVLFEHGLPALGLWSVDAGPSEGNTLGALLFWGYIGAAIYLTYDLTRTILALKKISRILGYGYRPVYVWTFALLGGLSFASASWNMLKVLAWSYQEWADRVGVMAPQRLFGQHSLLGPVRVSVDLWKWSLQSTLFRDFALAITADSARFTWALSSLGITGVVASWISIVGRKGKPLPKLWTFFALLQLLPTSITLNLFILALLFTPRTAPKQVVLQAPGVWIAAGLGYYFLLVEAPGERMKPYLIFVVLGARLLLFAPFVMGIAYIDPRDDALEKVSPLQLFDLPLAFGVLAAWSLLHQAYWAVEEFGVNGTWNAKSVHPAVSSLAYDAIQSLITIVAWAMSAPYARPEAADANMRRAEAPAKLKQKASGSKQK